MKSQTTLFPTVPTVKPKNPSQPKPDYSNSYILQLLRTDPWIFDARENWWPRGKITKAEVKKRFKSGKWTTNSGHFDWVMEKQTFEGTFEEFWEEFEKNKLKHWQNFLKGAQTEIENIRERIHTSKPDYPKLKAKREKNYAKICTHMRERIEREVATIRKYSKLLGVKVDVQNTI